MLIDFNKEKSRVFTNMNGGEGNIFAKMFMTTAGKFITCKIESGASIGLHEHSFTSDINFVISGEGVAICNDVKEILTPGVCHFCPSGSSHAIYNTGTQDLVLYTVVVNF